jgi:hypothetical protein
MGNSYTRRGHYNNYRWDFAPEAHKALLEAGNIKDINNIIVSYAEYPSLETRPMLDALTAFWNFHSGYTPPQHVVGTMLEWFPTLLEWEMDPSTMAAEYRYPDKNLDIPAQLNDILPLDSNGKPYVPKPTLDDIRKYRYIAKKYRLPSEHYSSSLDVQRTFWSLAIRAGSHFLLRALYPMWQWTAATNDLEQDTIQRFGDWIWGEEGIVLPGGWALYNDTGKSSIWFYAMQLFTRNFTKFKINNVVDAIANLGSYDKEDLAVEFFEVVYKLPEAEQLAVIDEKAAAKILPKPRFSVRGEFKWGYFNKPLPERLAVKLAKFKDFVTRCQSAPSVGPVNRKRKAEVDVIVIDD